MAVKTIVVLVFGLVLALVHPAEAQEARKVYRLGYLTIGTPSSAASFRKEFLDGLRQLGYDENQNLRIEYRYAEGRSERLPELAADLVRLVSTHALEMGCQGYLQLLERQCIWVD